MPPKKKKGKGSKLARMSEDEKQRYLQHRVEIELEAKRRKQQLIAAFTKNKLKREEAFARLNIAKINEQWRFQLRKIKCKELHEHLEYLWKYFDTALKAKNAVIDLLYEKLNTADIDHRKLQASHIKVMDKFINNYRTRLDKLHQSYVKSIMKIKIEELSDMNRMKIALYGTCEHLEVITYAQTICIEDKLMETKIRNAVNTNTIEYTKEEDKAYIEKEVGGKINSLQSILRKIIADYQGETKDKRKHYDSLVQQDIAHQDKVSCFPGLQLKLIHTIESLKYHEDILMLTQRNTVSQLENQIEITNKKIHGLRQHININQTINEIHLKKQTIISNNIKEHLRKLKQKSITLMQLMKMCSSVERLLSIADECGIYCNENSTQKNIFCAINPYDKLEKFWQQYNYIQTQNIFIKTDHNQLIIENNKLRDCLRSYLIAIAQVPHAKSPDYNLK